MNYAAIWPIWGWGLLDNLYWMSQIWHVRSEIFFLFLSLICDLTGQPSCQDWAELQVFLRDFFFRRYSAYFSPPAALLTYSCTCLLILQVWNISQVLLCLNMSMRAKWGYIKGSLAFLRREKRKNHWKIRIIKCNKIKLWHKIQWRFYLLCTKVSHVRGRILWPTVNP